MAPGAGVVGTTTTGGLLVGNAAFLPPDYSSGSAAFLSHHNQLPVLHDDILATRPRTSHVVEPWAPGRIEATVALAANRRSSLQQRITAGARLSSTQEQLLELSSQWSTSAVGSPAPAREQGESTIASARQSVLTSLRASRGGRSSREQGESEDEQKQEVLAAGSRPPSMMFFLSPSPSLGRSSPIDPPPMLIPPPPPIDAIDDLLFLQSRDGGRQDTALYYTQKSRPPQTSRDEGRSGGPLGPGLVDVVYTGTEDHNVGASVGTGTTLLVAPRPAKLTNLNPN